jgi:glycosyltransferase involved in cell wall biosynthesis
VSKNLVSVIIPTFNYSNFISEAIDSILNQNFPRNEMEIIVIDDGSTDNTKEVIKKYKDKVKYIYQQNSGKAWATKVGIDVSQGKYIFNLDADDLFLPDKLSKVVEVFEMDSWIIHVGHPAIYWYMNTNKKEIEPVSNEIKGHKIQGKDLLSYFYRRKMLFGGGSTFAGRADVLKKIPIKKEIDMYIDEYLVLFTLNHGYSFFIEEPLSIWRIHGGNFSDIKLDKEKIERNIGSMETVLSEVLNSDFEEEIKILYALKTKISRLAVKETLNKKSFLDIIDLWLYIFRNRRVFNKDIFRIIKNYTILNRSLPTSIIKLLKQAMKIW